MNRPYKVLIADDEKPVAAGLQGQLESLGYDVVAVVNDGQHAIEVCRRALPDVVLMDIEMPGLDGLSAARQIVRDPGTPVIILTAHGHPNLIDQAVEDGVLYYLLKPVTSPSLHAALQVAVARAREIKALRDNVNFARADAPRAEADRTRQGDPDGAAQPARRPRRSASCNARARTAGCRWPSSPSRSSRPTNSSSRRTTTPSRSAAALPSPMTNKAAMPEVRK